MSVILTILGDIVLGCMFAGFYALGVSAGSRRTALPWSTGMEVRAIDL